MGWIATSLRALLCLGVAAPVLLVGPSPACACSCVPRTDAEFYRDAGTVFVGELVSRRPGDGLFRSSTDPVTYVFAVSAVHKGTVSERQEVVSSASGASCGLEIEVGRRYVVFTQATPMEPDPTPRAGQLSANLCGGTRPAGSGAVAEAFGPGEAPVPGGSGEQAGRGVGERAAAAWPYLLGGALAVAAVLALAGWRYRRRWFPRRAAPE